MFPFLDTNLDGVLIPVIADYDFRASKYDELNFSRGEKLYLSPKQSNTDYGWLLAQNSAGKSGQVPSNYLRLIQPTSDTTAAGTTSQNQNTCQKINPTP